jgi:hypothetical protein
MNRKALIDNTVNKIMQLPDKNIQEVNDFADFLLSKIDDHLLLAGIQKLVAESKTFDYLSDEEDLYTVNDLKEIYK